MKAYEFPVKVLPGGMIELPDPLLDVLPTDRAVRVIILVGELEDQEEQAAWSRLTAGQFLAGYSTADAVYDRI